jgi:hypothetical protein
MMDPSPSEKCLVPGSGMGICMLACTLALAVVCGVVDGGDGDGHYSRSEGRKSVTILVMAMESEMHHLGWLSDCLSSRLPAAETRTRSHVLTVGRPQAAQKLMMLPACPPFLPQPCIGFAPGFVCFLQCLGSHHRL